MRIILLYILLVAFGCQQTPFLESENLKNSESEKGSEPQAMSNESFLESEKSVNISEICGNEKTNHKLVQKKSEKGSEQRAMSHEQKFRKAQSSQLEAQSLKKTVDCCPLTVDYFENQIRLADSLYKNYLPQYNFEEVKAAVMFFDSCEQRAMSHELFLESENFRTLEFEKRLKSQGRKDAGSQSGEAQSSTVNSCEYLAKTQRTQSSKAQGSQLEAQSTSQVFSFSDSQIQNNVDHHELLKFQNSKILEFLRARAHYYHAVGLTERDDIVGACEHYFIALEIMESETENLKTSKSGKGSEQRAMSHEQKFRNAHSSKLEAQSPDYEKIRFLSLIYTRLGELFYSENYCNLAISKHRKALRYKLLLGENKAVANTYKCLGNSYQLYDMPDSALYYYNKSLETNSELPNRLDVEKCIAHILFDRGEKDSAYVLLKNNLREIDNGNLKYSYYCTLGNMYFNDKKYDSALYYLETSLDNDIVTKKVAFTTKLSAIYDSLGDYDKRDYYDNFSAKMLLNNANKEVYNKQLQVLYDNYKERKNEREKSIAKVRTRKLIIAISLGVFVIVAFLLTYIKYMHRKQNNKLKSEIDDYVNKIDNYSKDIENQNIIINQKEKLINDYQITNDKKDKIIDKQKKEIDRIRTRLSKKNVNIEAYYASDICKKIVERKDSDFSCLKEDELALLLKSADEHLDNISERLHNSFLRLNKNDIYTICLLILNVKKSKLQYLLGKDRKTIWNRLNKIKRLMNVDENHDLFLYIKDNFLN